MSPNSPIPIAAAIILVELGLALLLRICFSASTYETPQGVRVGNDRFVMEFFYGMFAAIPILASITVVLADRRRFVTHSWSIIPVAVMFCGGSLTESLRFFRAASITFGNELHNLELARHFSTDNGDRLPWSSHLASCGLGMLLVVVFLVVLKLRHPAEYELARENKQVVDGEV